MIVEKCLLKRIFKLQPLILVSPTIASLQFALITQNISLYLLQGSSSSNCKLNEM